MDDSHYFKEWVLDFISKLKNLGSGKSDSSPSADAGDAKGKPVFKRDRQKAATFFKHAQTIADSRQYDYSIECYVNGLRHEPDSFTHHERLRDVAKRRKVTGGKPASLAEKLKRSSGKTAIDKMLYEEWLLAKDPLNGDVAMKWLQRIIDANKEQQDLHLEELAYWAGDTALDLIKAAKKPDANKFIALSDLFAHIPAYEKAAQACRIAINLDPSNDDWHKHLKDLEAESTLQSGHFDAGGDEGFRKNIRDAELQDQISGSEAIVKTEDTIASNVAFAKAAMEKEPDDPVAMEKMVRALLDAKSTPAQQQAIALLEDFYTKTSNYKYKVQSCDIQMRQYRNTLRKLQEALKAKPQDAQAKAQFQALKKKRDQFELGVFTEHTKQYPTDMKMRYELGVRLLNSKQYEDAISEFQKAQSDAKYKAASSAYLGQCYLTQQWYDLAIDALRNGITAHGINDDKLGLQLHYSLMNALEHAAKEQKDVQLALEAQKTASFILQTDIKYKDIRDRINTLKTLIKELQT